MIEPDAPEPIVPDEILTADELLQKRDPRIGVADAKGAVKPRRRWLSGGRRRGASQNPQREQERGRKR
ncbi:hypothetical protein [Kribbella kalugense]|uniref:Uncharacterized protein n=1 Tax=Kribbella kalugense TaxID=2512221 RepID=A0A4R7ZDL4_9ACTN|nr:hypothetical protein [Kribbella kalugense]TDW14218.1 hypothetical protein EV650_7801 [Kribbella kalugense]